MVKVRLARAGSKKRPYYHIVVTDKQNARDGRFIEAIGRYDPSQPITDARVQYERLDHWCGVGAQISDRVASILKEHRKAVGAAPAADVTA
ncbi:MAG: 30S ribosomal protein S16 [Myxococcales bacterium]|nr:30S ribosomal protein S16 [Myxococcales bacterium]